MPELTPSGGTVTAAAVQTPRPSRRRRRRSTWRERLPTALVKSPLARPMSLVDRLSALSTKPKERRYSKLQSAGYIVGHTIGSGAYAKVKHGIRDSTGERFAIKIICKSKAPSGYASKFLPREIDALHSVSHPNIVQIEEVLEDSEKIYMVMELAENGDLLEYINMQGPLTEADARNLFAQLVAAVQHCHMNGVVHRDLKCENILLGNDLAIKLADFGFARRVATPSEFLRTHCGSYAYAAPEILMNKPYRGPETDAWSLGVTLYAMLVGRLPFNDCDVNTLLDQITQGANLPRHLSRDCQDILRKLLSMKCSARIAVRDIKNHPWLGLKTDKSHLSAIVLPTITSVSSGKEELDHSRHEAMALRQRRREASSGPAQTTIIECPPTRDSSYYNPASKATSCASTAAPNQR